MPDREDGAGRTVISDTARAESAAAVPQVVARSKVRRIPRPIVWLPSVVAIGCVALCWQIVALHNPYGLPRLGAVWQQFSTRPGFFAKPTGVTLLETAVGLAVGFVIAFSLAVVMCHSRIIDRAVMPLAVMLNVTPILALAPGLALAFGFGYLPKFIITAIIVFFPFLVNSLAGLRSVDPEALDVLQTLDASRFEIFLRLRLPSSLPFLFAAARVCFPLSVVGAVVSDFVASTTTSGLGSVISSASRGNGGLPTIYAAIAILAAAGLILTLAVSFLEARFLSWHTSSRPR